MEKRPRVIYSIITRGLLCLLSVLLHFFPVLFLPINFGLLSNETGQKVIITADPTEVKNVIIKLGRGKQPSGGMTTHTHQKKGNQNPLIWNMPENLSSQNKILIFKCILIMILDMLFVVHNSEEKQIQNSFK